MPVVRARLAALALVVGTVVAGCSSGGEATTADTSGTSSGSTTSAESGSTGSASTSAAGSTNSAAATGSVEDTGSTAKADTMFDASKVHTISVEIDDTALKTMLQTYVDSGDKDWVKATVTIDGTKLRDVGMKLKGNSSLKGVTVDSAAQDLPWRIRLDKYVDDQNLDGYIDFTVRANSTETSINEAVSLSLLRTVGLASEDAIETRFSVNGSDETLRLTIQNLDDDWVEQNFPDAGDDSVLYKSDADGDWSWRGEDGDYTTSFDVEAGDEDNYTPLIALLDLVNNGTAEEIAEKLPTMLDIDSFATYLAFEDLIDNFDDIDGPGNNSYLFWDSATKMFTVVAWDHNLAFGTRNGGGQGGGQDGAQGGGPGGGQGGGQRPTDMSGGGAVPSGQPQPSVRPGGGQDGGGQGGGQGGGGQGGGPGGGAGGKDNPLVDAFKANTEWSALYDTRTTELKTQMFTSGLVTKDTNGWAAVVNAGASDLVPADTVTSEAAAVSKYASS